MIVGELSAPIRGDTRGFRRDLTRVEKMGLNMAQNLTGGMKNFGDSLKNIGAKLTQYITLPLLGATVAVLKLGGDFEAEMSKIVGLVGVSREQVDDWAKSIIEIAPDLAKSPQELAEALFFVSSAGIRGSEAMDVLKMSAKASTAGLGETKTIADLVTSAMNAYGAENLSASQATDILVAAVREGKAEAAELAGSMGQVLPLASELGVTFDQVAATQAAMTKTGTPATEAATQLKSIMAGLIKPSKQAEEQLQAMGTSASDMRKKIKEDGLLSALMDLRGMTNKYGEEAMARVFPNIRALMGVLDLMGNNLESNKKTFEAVSDSTGSLDKSFEEASDTLNFKWNKSLNKVKSRLLSMFDVVKGIAIPIMERFTQVIDFVAERFQALSPGFKKAVAGLVGSGVLLGPIIGTIGIAIAAAAGAIGAIISGITALAGAISAVGLPALAGIAAGIAAAAAIVAVYVTAIIAVIAGLIASFKHLWNTNAEFRNKVTATWNSIKETARQIFAEIKIIAITIFNGLKLFWAKHGKDITAIMSRVWNIIMVIVSTGMKIVRDVIRIISGVITGDWKKVWNSIKSIIKNASKIIALIFINLGVILRKLLKIMVRSILSILAKMGKGIIIILAKVPGYFLKAIKSSKSKFTSINWYSVGTKIISSIIRGIKAGIGELKNVVNNVAQEIRDRLPFSPAKIGPLSDLDKLNFGDPIASSLENAKKLIQFKTNDLGNILMSGLNGGLDVNPGTAGSSVNFTGDFNFYGVEDFDDFLGNMKNVLQRHTGKGVF